MPESDAKLRNIRRWRTAEYFHAVKIRGDAANHGQELKRHFLTDKREGALCRNVIYTEDTTDRLRNRRCERDIGRAEGSKGIRWLSPDAAQDTRFNHPHSAACRRQIPRRPSCTGEGRDSDLATLGRTKYGRLFTTESYQCGKRVCVTLDAIRKRGIGQMQIRGQERKRLMSAYDGETGQGGRSGTWGNREDHRGRSTDSQHGQDTIQGQGEAEQLDTRERKRGRILSKRRKSREEHGEKPIRNGGFDKKREESERKRPRNRTRGTRRKNRRRTARRKTIIREKNKNSRRRENKGREDKRRRAKRSRKRNIRDRQRNKKMDEKPPRKRNDRKKDAGKTGRDGPEEGTRPTRRTKTPRLG